MLRHLKFRKNFFHKTQRRFASSGYYVLLPQIPPDTFSTSETNELLNTTKVPSSFKIESKKFRDAIGLLSLNFESNVWKVEMMLKDPTYSRLKLLSDLDSSELDYAVAITTVVHIIENLPAFDKLLKRADQARNWKYKSGPIYYAVKELLADNPRNIQLQHHVHMGKVNGVELTPKALHVVEKLYADISSDLGKFNENISSANAAFKHLIADETHLGDMSITDVTAIAKDKSNPKRGPWVLNLNKQCYNAFMENSPVQALRWNLWQAYHQRASDRNRNNSVLLENVRGCRRRIAKTLGYRNNAELSLETKLAGNVHNVKSMIATLLVKCMPQQKKEHERLQEFATSQGFESTLKPWDVQYWRKKEREHLFGLQDLTFPYEETLASLLKFTSTLFPIEYEKVSDTHYRIHDKSTLVGQFVLDPFRTATKFPGMYTIRNKLFTTLIANFEPPIHGKQSCLTPQELTLLFEYFGHLLQKCFAPNDESIPVDFKIPGHFLTYWLGNKNFVESYLGLKDERLNNFLKSRLHFAATDVCHELYLSDLGLELDLSEEFWHDLVKKMWPTYSATELDKNKHLCSSILVHYGSQYYGDLWSRMLAADCYRAFVELREPKDLAVDGSRFYKSLLDGRDSSQPSERFRSFRGRDPSPDAFIWSIGQSCKFGRPIPGSCKCGTEKEPICGSDLEDYKNLCEFKCAQDCNPSLVKFKGLLYFKSLHDVLKKSGTLKRSECLRLVQDQSWTGQKLLNHCHRVNTEDNASSTEPK
ncbi:unnamed protein product [Allacma fusca]|uniref:Kazal-like domain-containing protein n=1 Tax=Allacma fusca TaxID=39272 RepID=A0A8J2JH38_9HEXA|nr:unnamed protein product [Allacma fusca]